MARHDPHDHARSKGTTRKRTDDGIDPTADSLHIGHLVSVMILKHFQMCGHRPLALVGGATGMIGDPSGKSQERNLLDEKTLRHNQEAIKRQLAKLLDFDSDAPNAAALVNNYDWMKDISFLEFIRDIGKCITVNYMMAKDSVKKRFNGEGDGMSFTEFTYQLVQGYDFLHLYETMNCKIQLGGADQWGNITTGTELIRRKLGKDAYAMGNSTHTARLEFSNSDINTQVINSVGTDIGAEEKNIVIGNGRVSFMVNGILKNREVQMADL